MYKKKKTITFQMLIISFKQTIHFEKYTTSSINLYKYFI